MNVESGPLGTTISKGSLAIEAHEVVKNYGPVQALKRLSLMVKEGSIFTLLGPNGAGKTTFVKSLLGLVSIQSGNIKIYNKSHLDSQARLQLGYLPEKFTFYSYYSILDTLDFFADLNSVPQDRHRANIDRVINLAGLTGMEERKLSTLSKGQLQRVGIASILVGEKSLLLLDEPFSGLDPLGVKDFKDLLERLKKEEHKTLFINSHNLAEMERIADQFAIIHKGECLAQMEMSHLPQGMNLEDYFTQVVRGQSSPTHAHL